MTTRIYTNKEGLAVYRLANGKWAAECEHLKAEEFDRKRDAMLAFGARFCPDCETESQGPTVEEAKAAIVSAFKLCRCGCGEAVAPKREYRPGHDARHAGQIARALIENDRDRAAEAARAALSGAMRAKVDRIRRNHAK